MTILFAIVMGFIQGATEFLPISSSGHLVIFGHLLDASSHSLLMDELLHIGTLGAVFVYYRRDLRRIITAMPMFIPWIRKQPIAENAERDLKFILYVILGTIPAVCVGLLLEDWITGTFNQPLFAAWMLMATGGILWASRFSGKRVDPMNAKRAWWIGVAQALAILPGISRSGATITTALLLSVDGEEAARYSFFLAIPAILGATLLTTLKMESSAFQDQPWPAIILGTMTAFVTGYGAIVILIRILKKGNFQYFSGYCWILGIFGIYYFWS